MKIYTILLLAVILAGSSLARAQESMIPDVSYTYLETLIATAQKNYPEVQVRLHQTAIAKNNITKTEVSWLDALNFSYFYRPSDKSTINPVDPYIFNGYQLGVNVNLGTLFVKPFSTKEAKEQYKVAQYQEQEYNLSLTAEVKKRYFAYIEQIAVLKLRTRSAEDAGNIAKQLSNKFTKGETTFEDYNRALLQTAEQGQFKILAESGVLTAKASLEEIIGDKLENVK